MPSPNNMINTLKSFFSKITLLIQYAYKAFIWSIVKVNRKNFIDMASVVASRFACLKIEGDDEPVIKKPDVNKGKKVNNKQTTQKKPEKKIKNNVKPNQQQQPQQSNISSSNGSAIKKKKSKVPHQNPADWEQWKQKDSEFVDGHFEDELQQAIVLSKLDYEEKEDIYKYIAKEKQNILQQEQLISKKKPMTLGQFNNMVEKTLNNHKSSVAEQTPTPKVIKDVEANEEFFDRIKSETKAELEKNKSNERLHRKQPSDEVITRSQFKVALDKKDTKINELSALVDHLKGELFKTKDRNKQLCKIMAIAEMREKGEILIQVERLHTVQEELTNEIASLHAQLEQERSKSSSYKPDYRSKDKKRRAEKVEKSEKADNN